ncbi:MAG: NAD-binding protein [Candidatus Micrarchaeota archaeon]|nr:NAD-binding protein [Candidatus Micrarchaeota archaeon]
MDSQLKIIYFGAILAVFVFGVLGTYIISQYGGFNVRGMSPFDAAYFTIVTMSTVGYGDVLPVSPLAKLFVMLLIVIGLSIFLSIITLISGEFVNDRMEKLSNRLSRAEKRHLRGHVVLIGTDGVNLAIASELYSKGTKFIMIVADKVVADRLRMLNYRTYVADATSELDMSQFQIHSSDKVIIDLRDSTRLVYALLVIRTIAKDVNKIIVIQDREAERHIAELGTLKNEKVVSPNGIAADSIIKTML